MKVYVTERPNGTRRVSHETAKTSRVEQSHRDQCNINTIMRKAHATGLVPQNNNPAHYGDFTNVSDYQTCQQRILEANEAFEGLPSNIRKRFGNNPANLISFLNDPRNEQEAQELGIIEKPVPEVIIPESPPESPSEASEGDNKPK